MAWMENGYSTLKNLCISFDRSTGYVAIHASVLHSFSNWRQNCHKMAISR
jgi:hypothetical protein